jgi:hypothetical protein
MKGHNKAFFESGNETGCLDDAFIASVCRGQMLG